MTITVKVHPPFWRLLRVVGVTAVVVLVAMVAIRSVPGSGDGKEPVAVDESTPSLDAGPLLMPVMALPVGVSEPEAAWISAFANAVRGQSEVAVEHGRADVVTDEFAFELDWLDKWHEGIGQALHYASATEKRPGLALIMRDGWPPDGPTNSKLAEIDRISSKQGIRIVLLRSSR
jgi:hypothetical protein